MQVGERNQILETEAPLALHARHSGRGSAWTERDVPCKCHPSWQAWRTKQPGVAHMEVALTQGTLADTVQGAAEP